MAWQIGEPELACFSDSERQNRWAANPVTSIVIPPLYTNQTATAMPRLHALQFDLATPPPRSTSVIVWLDGSQRHTVPVDANLDLLDVRQGNELIVAGKRRTGTAVRVYRGDGAGNATPLVECGREWVEA